MKCVLTGRPRYMGQVNNMNSPTELTLQVIKYLRLEKVEKNSKITERGLAEKLGVSRSPIRASLKQLEEMNVVKARPTGGYLLAMEGDQLDEFKTLEPSGPVEDLYKKITQDQISGKLPHEFLEKDLIERYEVPRNLLLKTLSRMASEGLIERKLGRGWICVPVIASEEADQSSYEFRMAIEPNIIRASTFIADMERLENCLAVHYRMHQEKLVGFQPSQIFEINADFHQMLADFSNNIFFQEAVRKQNQLRRLMESKSISNSERMLEACYEHIKIMEAIKEGQNEVAANLMTYHLIRASNDFEGKPQ